MTKTILLLGRQRVVVDDVLHQLESADIQLFGGTSIADVRSAFAQANIDHVFIGGGFDLETRLEMVREIFQVSETTTVHLKDRASGSRILPFWRSVLRGLKDYEA